MGTHPIFESDFDCLTEIKKMSSEFGTPETPGYVGMAERLRRMQSKTPDRFRRDPAPRPVQWEGRKRATQPRTPRFARDTKSSRLREMREQEKEKRSTTTRKVSGAPRFATAARAKMKPKWEEPKVEQFKAQPIRRFKNVNNSSRLSTCSQTTEVQPFTFDNRVRTRRTTRQTEAKPQMQLFHQPGEIPDLSGTGVGNVTKKEVTRPAPFKFNKENESTVAHKADERFMKQALKGHQMQRIEAKPVTVPIEPANHLEQRGEERKEYDIQLKATQKQAERQQAQLDEEKRLLEEEETRVLRATVLIHKPEPIKKYKPVPDMNRKELTRPKTPNAARAQVRQPRQSRRLRQMKPNY